MKLKTNYSYLFIAVNTVALFLIASPSLAASSFTDAFTAGKAYVDFRLRYESVDQDNALEDADALILRTKFGYKTAEYSGFSALIEVEDSRTLFGVDDFSVPPAGVNAGQFSVIADPETTEVDQAFVQYNSGFFNAKIGRQVITLDNHRFVGHVGWRQDRQTFDGATVKFAANDLSLQLSQLTKRNRIFAEEADRDSEDTLFNASYKTSFGKFTGYAYLLELDNDTDNSLDTYGLRFNGSSKIGETKVSYAAEFASQEANDTVDTDYVALEGGVTFLGVSAKLGFESLGSDDGNGGFATPLATLHKFNGWADQFLATPAEGLEDVYVSLSTKLGGGSLKAIYHDFSSDVAVLGADDLGDEIDIVYSRKFAKNYSFGAKYASYSAGDDSFGRVDVDKVWLWVGAGF